MSRGIRRTLWRFFGAMCVWCVWRGNFVTKRATASRALGLRCVALEHRGNAAKLLQRVRAAANRSRGIVVGHRGDAARLRGVAFTTPR